MKYNYLNRAFDNEADLEKVNDKNQPSGLRH